MRNAILLIFLFVSCTSYVPRNLRGMWVNNDRSFLFTKDSVYIQESRLAQVGCFVEKRHDPVSRLSLIVVNDGDDYDLVVGVPYAIFNVHKDTLRVQQVSIRGIKIQDFQYFPWPTKFEGDSIWVFRRYK